MKKFLALHGLAVVFAVMVAVTPAQAALPADVKPLSQQELAQHTGGFILPNGLDLKIGIDHQVFLNGTQVGDGAFNNGATRIAMGADGLLMITNTANNQVIRTIGTVSIDVANYSKIYPQSMNALATLQAQALVGLSSVRH